MRENALIKNSFPYVVFQEKGHRCLDCQILFVKHFVNYLANDVLSVLLKPICLSEQHGLSIKN